MVFREYISVFRKFLFCSFCFVILVRILVLVFVKINSVSMFLIENGMLRLFNRV